jgi:hypothetical protein
VLWFRATWWSAPPPPAPVASKVVVEETVDGAAVAVRGVVRLDERARVLTDQVVLPIAPRSRLVDQVVIAQRVQLAARLVDVGAIESGGGVGVDLTAGVQGQSTEQPLPRGRQALVWFAGVGSAVEDHADSSLGASSSRSSPT